MKNTAVAAHQMDEHTNMLSCSECGVLGPCPRDTPEERHTINAASDHLAQAHSYETFHVVRKEES
jgi:hypothetical protein